MSKSLTRRPGGQKSNLNASRHPWRAVWKRFAVRPEHQHLARLVERDALGMVTDLGGPESITTAQAALIRSAMITQLCQLLCAEKALETGGYRIDANGDEVAHPALKEMPKYSAELRQIFALVGLERKARKVGNLEDYLKARKADEVIEADTVEVEH